jgi:hypothetical protein
MTNTNDTLLKNCYDIYDYDQSIKWLNNNIIYNDLYMNNKRYWKRCLGLIWDVYIDKIINKDINFIDFYVKLFNKIYKKNIYNSDIINYINNNPKLHYDDIYKYHKKIKKYISML